MEKGLYTGNCHKCQLLAFTMIIFSLVLTYNASEHSFDITLMDISYLISSYSNGSTCTLLPDLLSTQQMCIQKVIKNQAQRKEISQWQILL